MNNEPTSIAAREKMSLSNIGNVGKLGWRASPEVLQRMSDGASRRGTHDLGIDITNQVFQDLYPDSTLIGYFAHGYDFIDPDGSKIDVKGATPGKRRWAFNICKNTIADWFFLMLFTDDYNLVKMYKIPGNVVSHLSGIGISEGTYRRWEEYEVSILF